jgi:hypothetical protein
MVQGARPSRSPGGASRAALPVKDVFDGTPTTARETHALPTHFAFQQCRVKEGRKISDNRKYFGNISEKQPFPEKILDYFFRVERPSRSLCGASRRTAGQSQSNQFRVRRSLTLPGQIVCKLLKMNGL